MTILSAGDPIAYLVRDSVIALSSGDASLISVDSKFR